MHPFATNAVAVDLFCGAGGLTRGLLDAGIQVVAGYDIDPACRHAFEHNNSPAKYIKRDITDLTGEALSAHYPPSCIRILAGCAPCQPFSKYAQGSRGKKDGKWKLLDEFARLVFEAKPHIVSMENVPELARHQVFEEFLCILSTEGFHFAQDKRKWHVFCPDYGLPQRRSRLVIIASRLGEIELAAPTHRPAKYLRVRDILGNLPRIGAGEICNSDPLHRSSRLSTLNLRRIRHSTPGGTWRDWPVDLIARCHRESTGRGYSSVYGRMDWDDLSPTMTTQFYGFGNGRFGHPSQDRGLSLREGALLQSFPKDYEFVEPNGTYHFKTIGRMIGNAVPVRLGEIVGKTIYRHIHKHYA